MVETTAAAMSVCPFNTIVAVLSPLMQTSTYPMIRGVIKMLTKHVEMNPQEVTDEHLNLIMPGLVTVSNFLFKIVYEVCFSRDLI